MVRTRISALSFVFAATLAGSFALPAAAQDIPQRKSGLWEITIETKSAHSPPAKGGSGRTISQCVDQARDDVLRQMGQQMERDMKCTRTNIVRSAGGMSFESSCDFGNMKTTSKSVITGDFNTAYKMEIRSRYDPPMMGMAEGTTLMDVKWVGACKAGQRPGDMIMPGGMTMNVYDAMETKKK